MAVETFGSRLRTLRRAANESQVELGKALDVDSGTVSRWERDEGHPHFQELKALAAHYAVTLDFLAYGAEHQVSREVFDRFLQTEAGRLAQQHGHVRTLLSMRTSSPPTERLYRAMTMALLLEADEKSR